MKVENPEPGTLRDRVKKRLRRRDLSIIGVGPAIWWQVGERRGKGVLRHDYCPDIVPHQCWKILHHLSIFFPT